jgi:tRNA U34 5-carboxymethylaminomethyl modifying enzyme MnmG/GidA
LSTIKQDTLHFAALSRTSGEQHVLKYLPQSSVRGEQAMGWGSAGTPPWVDEESIDMERMRRKAAEDAARIRALEQENEALKKRIKELEDKLKKRG